MIENITISPLPIQYIKGTVIYDANDSNEALNIGESDNDLNQVEFIAHRGYSAVAPENTIPAYIAAAENGFTTVECDIEWTKDNVPVLLHDDTINRTARRANGWKFLLPKKCSKLTYEKLQKYDFGIWKDKEFKGTKIPTFSELLQCCKDYGLNVYVDLKSGSSFDEERAKILTDAVKEAGLENNVTWISFDDNNLKLINNIMPDSRLGYLSKTQADEETINILQDLDTEENDVFLDIKSSQITPDTGLLLENSGFDLETWTVNTDEELKNLTAVNCKGITTDVFSNASEFGFLD